MKVGRHKGSTPSSLLFIVVMDDIFEAVGRGQPRSVLFANDLMICENTREQESNNETCGGCLLRMSDYESTDSNDDSNVTLGGEDITNVSNFKYLGSMFDAEEEPTI